MDKNRLIISSEITGAVVGASLIIPTIKAFAQPELKGAAQMTSGLAKIGFGNMGVGIATCSLLPVITSFGFGFIVDKITNMFLYNRKSK